MEIIYQGIVLLSFFSFMKAQTQECDALNTAAKNLVSAMRSAPTIFPSVDCHPNKQCSGVKCTWSSSGILEVDLHYCKNPVTYHVYLKGKGITARNYTLQESESKVLYSRPPLVNLKINVVELNRTGNTVTTSVVLLVCTFKCHKSKLVPMQTFCVQMDKCPEFNSSIDHYEPCNKQATTYKPPRTSHGSEPSNARSSSFKPHSLASLTQVSTNPDPPQDGKRGYNKGNDKDDSSKDLSTGAIIGICAAGLFVVVFVVMGAAVYWKKYHHRSRLRAAYYNDISMHDPLYEDFGPEVA